MKKKIISLLLCICIISAYIPLASAYSNVSAWAQEAVDAMNELGFLPDSLQNADMTKSITRAQMCQMAVSVFNYFMGTPDVGPDSTDHFDDTSDPAINYAFEQGIVSGTGNNKFAPNDPLTRQDFFKIVYNMMGSAYWDPHSITLASLDRFDDAASVSAYAVEPTQVMVAIGVVQGTGTSLTPLSSTSIQEAILMFFRAYRYLGDWFNAQTEDNKSVQIYAQGYSNISTWAIHEVFEMQSNQLIPSCLDNCDMSMPITRAQMCSIALLAYNKLTGRNYTATGSGHFPDSSDPDVDAAFELGIIKGYGDGTFGPNNTLTRQEFFQIMSNFMTALDYPRTDSRAVSLSSYKDGGKVDAWAQASARLMIYVGAVRGDGTNLNPLNATTVEEAIAIFLRCYKYTLAWKNDHPNGEPELDEHTALIDDLISFARSFEGYPYVYGGGGPNSFDCSGLVLYVYRHFGYSLYHGAQKQYLSGVNIGYNELLPGDLVFFCNGSTVLNSTNSSYTNINHVGIYLGNGYFIHAANSTRGVVIESLRSGYYYNHFWGACRIITD